jgi:signal transduction histidine kinase/CheY-like chemotaxis protein
MGNVVASQQHHAFLSTETARSSDKKLARLVVGISLLGFIVGLAFVRMPLAQVPAFIPAYEAALWINDTLTAALLFSQFASLRSRALLALGAGYLFNALMIVAHALSFPGVFSPTGLMGSGPQTTAWLYIFWHSGFPLFVLAYAVLARRPIGAADTEPGRSISYAIAGVALLAAALTLLATAGHDLLPEVIHNNDYSLMVSKGFSPATCALSVGVLIVLWRRGVRTVLDLWLMVVMTAWVLDIALSAVIGSHRYDLGFYAGRLYGLLAASFVLGTLLFEMNRLYRKVGDALTLAEMRYAELARSREEFARVQRFEAIGQLVGGVAHDFNNLLTVITGALDLMLRDKGLTPKMQRMLDMSMKAARRGEKLTGQLLTFARKQILQPEVLNPNEVIVNLEAFISGGTGEQIEVVSELSPVLWPVRLDRAQFETALINLTLNARDALNGEGRVVIRTRNIALRNGTFEEIPEGDYVVASVTDTGNGMPPEVLARAYDPFFTTKEVGKGTGLGLSQVYGFIQSASGHIRIDSEVGRGTTVEMYLPKSTSRPAQTAPGGLLPIRASTGNETILVVEDDSDVLSIAVAGLLELGYEVKTAMDAQQALTILRETPGIDVLFSDVIMPGGMNGAQLAVEARRLRPELKILLTSGYTAAALSENHGLSERLEVLHKPYRREELATKLRLVIGEG